MRAAAYLRVSSGQQSTDNQLPDIEALARAKGYEITGFYAENESSWKSGHQHELARLLEDLRSGRRKYDALLVWSIDRLCRGGIGPIFSLVNSFTRLGVRVESCRESWLDSSGPAGDLLLAIVAWIAGFESVRKSERVLAGQARAVREGKKLGRPLGSKDKKPRHKAGYLSRWAGKQTSAGNQAQAPELAEVK